MNGTTSENFDLDMSQIGQSTAVMSTGREPNTSIAIGTPAASMPCERITVHAQTIQTTDYGASSAPVACFDVVFNVGVQCEDGSCRTYQIVKRIGVDKCRIAAEVEHSMPVSIVEEKKADATSVVEEQRIKTIVNRARQLAGLD
jgi:hypothetical protein